MEPRYRKIVISCELLASWLGQGWPEGVVPNEPVDDLKIVAVRDAPPYLPNEIELIVWSSTFDVVADAEMPPVWTPDYTLHTEPVPA